MKRLLPVLVLLLAGCFVRARGEVYDSYESVSPEAFSPSLDPYGNWLVLPGYGRAWQPAQQYVGADFYPYGTGGRWLYTNAGWVFDSDYPFGWAVFHYGRWYRDVTWGWLWLPGKTWAPAWVSWRAGGPYIGWAPLGPRGALGSDSWCFVPTQRFTTGYPRRYSVDAREYHRAVAVTQPLQARRDAPRGPPASYVSSATRERIVPVPLRQVPSAGRAPPPSSSRDRGRFNAPPFDSQRRQARVPAPPAPPPGGFDSGRRDRSAPPPSGGFDSDRRAQPQPLNEPGPTIPRPDRMGAPQPSYQRPSRRNSPRPSGPAAPLPPPPPPPRP